jgi:NAD(P)-dependent dehydrogenase (short-subunit alcohol dehydrogenase family)
MDKLSNKTAVVTGGTSGIGLAIAKAFVDAGAKVVITGRRQGVLDAAIKTLGDRASGFRGDVADLDDLDRLYASFSPDAGIDVLVANAGIAEIVPFAEVTEDHFDRIFDINVKGTLFTVQKALPYLNDGASIILMGSVSGVKGAPGFGVYGASKAAIRNLVRGWSLELKHRNIRSNVISPGPVDTPATQGFAPDAMERIASTVPMGRIGTPEEIAKAALFLASDDASFITGIELFVDGGRAQV